MARTNTHITTASIVDTVHGSYSVLWSAHGGPSPGLACCNEVPLPRTTWALAGPADADYNHAAMLTEILVGDGQLISPVSPVTPWPSPPSAAGCRPPFRNPSKHPGPYVVTMSCLAVRMFPRWAMIRPLPSPHMRAHAHVESHACVRPGCPATRRNDHGDHIHPSGPMSWCRGQECDARSCAILAIAHPPPSPKSVSHPGPWLSGSLGLGKRRDRPALPQPLSSAHAIGPGSCH